MRGPMTTSRRVFLRQGAFALVSLGFAPSFLSRTVLATSRAGARKRLIAVFQRGAVDGLNVVVPFGEPDYARARPSIAIGAPTTKGGAIDLNGFFGLHPKLAPLLPLWRQRQLAIIHACGSPDATRSHFDAQDYMETATPGVKRTDTGWLNRYLQARPDDAASPVRAVALTPQLPRAFQGPAPVLAVGQLGQFGIRAAQASRAMSTSFEEEYARASDQVLGTTAREAFDAMRQLGSLDLAKYHPAGGASYPKSAFGTALQQIAQLAKSDVGLEVAFAEVGGWDTHVNQGAADGQLANRLDDFAEALAALVTDLGDQMADTVVLTMSEFGRAVAENGNRGTDHGHGNVMLVMGGGVGGGRVLGRWPGLTREQRHDGRDLAVTTDFRDVFAEVVTRHLGLADASAVFPGYALDAARFPGLWS